jgi:hypothetical protein
MGRDFVVVFAGGVGFWATVATMKRWTTAVAATLGLAAALRAQTGEFSLTLTLSDAALLSDTAPTPFPNTFRPGGMDGEFARETIAKFRAGKLKLYRDPQLRFAVSYKETADEILFFDHFRTRAYQKKGKLPKNAQGLPEYAFHLAVRETWKYQNGELVERKPSAGVLLLSDERKPRLAPYRFYFAWLDAALPVEKMRMLRDYPGSSAETPRAALEKLRYNFVCHENAPPGRDIHADAARYDEKINAAYLATLIGRPVPVARSIPLRADEKNYDSQAPYAPVFDSTANILLFQTAVPLIWKGVLTGKIPLWQNGKRVAPTALFQRINTHPAVALPADKKSVRNNDYSFGVEDVQVYGRWEYPGDTARFVPTHLEPVWTDRSRAMDKVALGRIELRRLEKYRVGGVALAEFLSRAPYYYYTIAVHDVFPQTLAEAYFVDELLRKKERLPSQNHWKIHAKANHP